MPHVRAIFGDAPNVREFLRTHREQICLLVARHANEPPLAVALIPQVIPKDVEVLAYNVLELEFVIEVGKKVGSEEEAERIALAIASGIRACEGAEWLDFGVWFRALDATFYIEQKSV